jgi:anti-sigma factor RsiW
MREPFDGPLNDIELGKYFDGELSAEDKRLINARLATDSAAQLTLATWKLQREAIRELHIEALNEPLTPLHEAPLREAQRKIDVSLRWKRLGGMAAGLLLAFGAGWLAKDLTLSSGNNNTQSATTKSQSFVKQASIAHAAYTPEQRHAVEVAATEQEHLVRWLSKRVGKELKIPLLTEQGFELVGGRLLPSEDGARALFMFQNSKGNRLTMYLGAIVTSAPNSLTKETSFKFSSEKDVSSFYWIDNGFGYAISANLPRDALMGIAQAIYAQL